MLSAIIVFSQLFFVSKIDFRKKVYIMLIFIFSIIAITAVARVYNYDIGKVIDERILERGTNLASARTRVTSFEVFLIKFRTSMVWSRTSDGIGCDSVTERPGNYNTYWILIIFILLWNFWLSIIFSLRVFPVKEFLAYR
jgi:hypothetical protein